jgi:hypothetical protein
VLSFEILWTASASNGNSGKMEKDKSRDVLPSGTAVDWAAISFLWCVAVLVVKPIGNFPLNDDWAWGMTVKRLVEGGGYHPTGWAGMTLITQVLWGALFCIPKGFSFNALRVSALVLALLGVLAMYSLVRRLNGSRFLAICCALTLACNPIYFALSNTFMTDVPFTTMAILASFFYVRHLQNGGDLDLIIGTAISIAAVLCRQLGLCLPLALGATLLLKHGFQRRWIIRAVVPLLISILVLGAFQHWLRATGRLPALYSVKTDKLRDVLAQPARIPVNVAYFGWSMLMYLGWFLAPVMVLTGWWKRSASTRPRVILLARLTLGLFLVASIVRFLVLPKLMPVHNNIIIPEGIGPASLRDTLNLHLPNLPALPAWFWLAVTALSLAGAAVLVFIAAKIGVALFPTGRFEQSNDDGLIATFFLLSACSYLVPFVLTGFFDRYLLPVTAFLAAFLAVSFEPKAVGPSRARQSLALLLILAFGVFAIAGTRDYFEWNRTRWHAVEELLTKKDVKPQDVDGGFEFNGWYMYDTFTMTNWWVVTGPYVISFGKIEGYEPISNYTYQHWMPPYEGTIFVLKRKSQD